MGCGGGKTGGVLGLGDEDTTGGSGDATTTFTASDDCDDTVAEAEALGLVVGGCNGVALFTGATGLVDVIGAATV